MKLIIIVQEGEWGDLKREKGDYNSSEALLVATLSDMEGVSVMTRETSDEALEEIGRASDAEGTLIFTTRGMFSTASEIKALRPELRVVVITGLPHDLPKNSEVEVVGKPFTPSQIRQTLFPL